MTHHLSRPQDRWASLSSWGHRKARLAAGHPAVPHRQGLCPIELLHIKLYTDCLCLCSSGCLSARAEPSPPSEALSQAADLPPLFAINKSSAQSASIGVRCSLSQEAITKVLVSHAAG